MTEAELLFSEALNCDRVSLYFNRHKPLKKKDAFFVSAVLKRRIKKEPLQYILGKSDFMGLKFKVDPSVLIPRQETEILVETTLKYAVLKILDLGTGSGCIAVSLAKMSEEVEITAVDISEDALNIARQNALLNNVAAKIKFIQSDLFTAFYGKPVTYNLIVSNPPYISTDEIANLQPEISYEPRIALDGGSDGLDFYRRIIKEAPSYLSEGGFLILEMGFNQCKEIKNIFEKTGNFEIMEVVNDYSGIERVIVGRLLKNG